MSTKLLKRVMPTGSKVHEDGAEWYKRGGHAGTQMVHRLRERATAAGFATPTVEHTGSPDGSVIGHTQALVHPDGWVLTSYMSYGNTAYDNSFGATIKRSK
jgi:hypothetical protein